MTGERRLEEERISEEEHRELDVNCIDFPSNISFEHLTTTLKYETCFRR
tara:strand:+ start:2085 stop:2231 length:147 start_codon:yes stop_codon:yes gene_type:complete